MESGAYRGPKYISNIFSNDDEALAKERGLKNVASKNIVDDVLLYGRTSRHIIAYFRTVLDVLKHHRATLKLKKFQWFQERCKLLGLTWKKVEHNIHSPKMRPFSR